MEYFLVKRSIKLTQDQKGKLEGQIYWHIPCSYPAPAIQFLCEFEFFITGQFINHELKQDLRNIFARAPFAFFPQRDTYVNYPDAVYYQRGIHNIKARSLEFLINIPALEGSHGKEPDYNLIQKIWWTAFEMVEDSKEMVNTTLEMRVLKGSEATGMELLFYWNRSNNDH